jgi:hypothetical protein
LPIIAHKNEFAGLQTRLEQGLGSYKNYNTSY